VQAPTKYELAINLKTAKNLGLDMPTPVLAALYEGSIWSVRWVEKKAAADKAKDATSAAAKPAE